MQLVSAPPPGPFLDTWAPPGAGRRRENQLGELILNPIFAIPPFAPPDSAGARFGAVACRGPFRSGCSLLVAR
eukprot:7116580-Pyramimonas_sp.AAC.1